MSQCLLVLDERTVCVSLDQIQCIRHVRQLLKELTGCSPAAALLYRDEEGMIITIKEDIDLVEAVQCSKVMSWPHLAIAVVSNASQSLSTYQDANLTAVASMDTFKNQSNDPVFSPTTPPTVHDEFVCNTCFFGPIVGRRLHCIECDDVDTCFSCELSHPHAHNHLMQEYSHNNEPVLGPRRMWDAQCEGDVTLPAGTVTAGGKEEVKIWKVKNTGFLEWDFVTLVLCHGDSRIFDNSTSVYCVPNANPDESVHVMAILHTPSPMLPVRLQFQLQNADVQPFGAPLSVFLRR